MASIASKNRLRLASEIARYGAAADIPCDRCCETEKLCVVMEVQGRSKCSECVRRGRAYVSFSWEALDRTRQEYEKKVANGEEELARVLSRLMRDKKILKQAEARAGRKTECLAKGMEESGELEVNDDCPAADACVGLSPVVWETMWNVDQALLASTSGVAPSIATSTGA